jgi:hypothetical protein
MARWGGGEDVILTQRDAANESPSTAVTLVYKEALQQSLKARKKLSTCTWLSSPWGHSPGRGLTSQHHPQATENLSGPLDK